MTPCLDCGRLLSAPRRDRRGIRCEACHRRHEARRNWYKGDWPKLSRQLRQSASKCAICGKGFTPDDPSTVDHVIPRSREGGLQVVHRSCNARKAAG